MWFSARRLLNLIIQSFIFFLLLIPHFTKTAFHHRTMDFIYSNVWQNNDKRRCCWYFFLAIAFILSGCAAPAPKVTHRHPETIPPVVSPAEQTLTPSPSEVRTPAEQETVLQPAAEFSSEDTVGPVSPDAMVTAADDLAASVHTVDYIEQRLTAYEKKHQQWLDLYLQNTKDENQRSFFETDSCQDKLNAVLSGYTNLHSQLQLTTPSADKPKPQSTFQEILKLDIAFLESECEQRLTHSATLTTQGFTQGMDLNQEAREAERAIDTYFNEEQFDQVIAMFQQVTETYPSITLSLQALKQYGLAQLYNSDIDEATDAFSQALTVIDANSRMIEPWAAQRLLADLFLVSGKPNEAREVYKRLLASSVSYTQSYSWATRQLALLKESNPADPQKTYYLDLLREALIFHMNGQSPKDLLAKADRIVQLYPNTSVADSAIRIKQDIENQLREWTDKQLQQVEILTNEKKYQQALTILAAIHPGHLPADLQEQVQLATVAVKTAENQGQEVQRILLEESLAREWKSANNLLDSQQFDPAIAIFTSLLDTSYDAKSQEKIQEATNLAAVAQRKQAASLFIKAVKARSSGNKTVMLLESKQLLQEVLRKYPQADIIDKVAQNLTTIEQHIAQLNPTLLEE